LAKLARAAVIMAALLSFANAALLLTMTPPDRCRDWVVAGDAPTSLWLLWAFFSVPVLAVVGLIAVRWRWAVRKAAETARYPAPVEHVLVAVCIMGAFMSQAPLFVLVSRCTDWLKP